MAINVEDLIGKTIIKARSVDEYGDDYKGEFPVKTYLEFDDNTKLEITYCAYPEGSSWLEMDWVI